MDSVTLRIGTNALFYEDFVVGKEWITPSRTITEADVVNFAGVSGDYNPIHTDEEYAKKSPYGARLVHGPAIFAIATGLEFRLGLKEGTAIAFLGMVWDLKAAVKIGETIHVYQRVASKRLTSNPKRGIVNFWLEVRNQNDVVCQQGEWKVMFHARPTS